MKLMRRRWISMLLCAAMLLQLMPGFAGHAHAQAEEARFSRPDTADITWQLQKGWTYLPVLEVRASSTEKQYYTITCGSGGSLAVKQVALNEDGTLSAPGGALQFIYDPTAAAMSLTDGRTLVLQGIVSVAGTAPENYRTDWMVMGGAADGDYARGALFGETNSETGVGLKYLMFSNSDQTPGLAVVADLFNSGEYTGYYLYEKPCEHSGAEEIPAVPATCTEPGAQARRYCGECEKWFADREMENELWEGEYVTIPATGHSYGEDGACQNCGTEILFYYPVKSVAALEALAEGTAFMLVAETGEGESRARYTLKAPGAEMGDTYRFAGEWMEVLPDAEGIIPAPGAEAAQFELVRQDGNGYLFKLPNHWMVSSPGGGEPFLFERMYDPDGGRDQTANFGYWVLDFYGAEKTYTDAAMGSTTYEAYLGQMSKVKNFAEGSLLAYNGYGGDIAQAMRLRDYVGADGTGAFYMAMGADGSEPAMPQKDEQYALWLYAASGHAHVMGAAVGADETTHKYVCTVPGCGYALYEEHTVSDDHDERQHWKTCGACGYETARTDHRTVYRDLEDGTHSASCGVCDYVGIGEHVWSGWSYSAELYTHERFCTDCGSRQEQSDHIWSEEVRELVQPSCHGEGEISFGCSAENCDVYRTEPLAATGHTMSRWFTEKEPTQVKEGLQVRYCMNCYAGADDSGMQVGYQEQRSVPALGHEHTLEYVAEKTATCRESGCAAHYRCVGGEIPDDLENGEEYEGAGCGALFLDGAGTQRVTLQEITVEIGEHSWGQWTVSAKNEAGSPCVMEYRSCTLCEEGYEERIRPAESHTEHTLVYVEGRAPTCYLSGEKAHYVCADPDGANAQTGCGCLFADADGQILLSPKDLVEPATGHKGTLVAEVTANGHMKICSACRYSQFLPHVYVLPGCDAGECYVTCFLCEEGDEGYKRSFGSHAMTADWRPCDDRWQHRKVCANGCGYELIADHTFGLWQYSAAAEHYRSCDACGIVEQTAEHIWDSGNEVGSKVIFTCVSESCGAEKTEYLRCVHTCFVCGGCAAEGVCPGKDGCICGDDAQLLPLTEPEVITNDVQLMPYLGDILVKDAQLPLEPGAKPGVIPEEFAGYTVDIKEIPLENENALQNPYTRYVLEALEGYEPQYLFDIQLLDDEQEAVQTDGEIQVLVKLQLEAEIVADLRSGLLRLAHVTDSGTVYYGTGGIPFYRLRGTDAWFWTDSFSPFALVQQEATCYGRSALATLANRDSLLFAYDALVEGVENSVAKIQIFDADHSITRDEARVVMDAYTRDHTEHFWLGSQYSMVYSKATGSTPEKVKYIKPTYTLSGDALTQARGRFDAKVETMLAGVAQMNDFDKQVTIHDRLAAAVVYDYSFTESDIYNAYGALVGGKAVCQGYAEALQYLLRRVGIQSFIVTGFGVNSNGDTVSHAWNQVKMEDAYYHTDVTWNDQITGDEGYLYHAYFNVSDSYIQEDHSINVSAYPLAQCDTMNKNYFMVKSLTRESFSDDDLAELLEDNDYQVSLLVYGGTATVEEFINWLRSNYQNVAQSLGISGAYSYSYSCLGREVQVTFHFARPGVAVSAAVSDGAVNVQVAVENAGDVACDLAVAVYDSSDRLIGIIYRPAQTMGGGAETVRVSFGGGIPAKVKTFVLGDSGMPLLKAGKAQLP